MSDALNPADILRVGAIFLPNAQGAIDGLILRSLDGTPYRLTAVEGYDAEVGEVFFYLHRESFNDTLVGGQMLQVDPSLTRLRSVYRNRKGVAYERFEEFFDAEFHSDEVSIAVSRHIDDYQVEGLRLEATIKRQDELSKTDG